MRQLRQLHWELIELEQRESEQSQEKPSACKLGQLWNMDHFETPLSLMNWTQNACLAMRAVRATLEMQIRRVARCEGKMRGNTKIRLLAE
jgi:hypothetical protein